MFEKGKLYSYDDIEKILHEAREFITNDLREESKEKLDSSMSQMIFQLNTEMSLSLFITYLLNGSK